MDLQNAFHVVFYNNTILGVFDDIEKANKAIEEIPNWYVKKYAKITSIEKNKIHWDYRSW